MTDKASVGLAELLDTSHRWLRYRLPFEHVVATDVFQEHVYKGLEHQFSEWLSAGCSDVATGPDTGFSRGMGSYDAYGYTFTQAHAGAFDVLLSPAWCGLLARLFGIEASHHVNLGLHHHDVGSATGWPHTDLAPGWFADDRPQREAATLSDPRTVNYQTGAVQRVGVTAVEEVRAVAVLLYLANGPWRPGDGGETGLFDGPANDARRPAVLVPPLDNSVLAFECTPMSFHTFLSNTRRPRNCLVMWLHRPKWQVLERWGDQAIAYWRTGAPS